jgi:hypothetical protein
VTLCIPWGIALTFESTSASLSTGTRRGYW